MRSKNEPKEPTFEGLTKQRYWGQSSSLDDKWTVKLFAFKDVCGAVEVTTVDLSDPADPKIMVEFRRKGSVSGPPLLRSTSNSSILFLRELIPLTPREFRVGLQRVQRREVVKVRAAFGAIIDETLQDEKEK